MIEEYHIEERKYRERIERLCPSHPILKRIFPSTFEALQEYLAVLRELEEKEEYDHKEEPK